MKKRLQSLLLLLALLTAWPLPVRADTPKEYLIDDAGLLSDSEAGDLKIRLENLSDQSDMDFVILTEDDSSVTSPQDYADDYFDYNGYGRGDDRSGSLLYINMGTRDWYISTRGDGITAFTDAGIEYIGDQITDDLGNGDYYDAFDHYITLCDEFVAQADAGEAYDSGHMPKEPYPFVRILLISLGAGLVIAGIYIWILRSQLKSVAPNESAADYVKNGSLNVTNAREMFLYHTVHRTPRPQETSHSSGGSSTHTSSSGATHGGGGGKF